MRQIGERKLRRGDTVYDMKVSLRKAPRADCENNLTIVKTIGGVAHFFHNGPSACHNNMELLTLWRRTIVKMASGFFHNGPAGWRLGSNRPNRGVPLTPCVKKVARASRWQRKILLVNELM
jgi:hypothetical protein